jgi:hypothetical protein
MPAVAILGAGAAWALGGGAAIGGVIAGTATLATTLTAVATVGATLGAVGAVTGDKTLSTIGMAMGAVGGIGSLAANAGLFGDSATTASLFGVDPTPAAVSAPDIAGEVPGISADDLASWAQTPTLPGMETAANDVTGAMVGQTGALDATAALPTTGLENATQAASGDAAGLINSPGASGSPGIKTLVSQNVDDATNQLVKGTGGGTIPSGSPTDQASINAAGSGTTPPTTGADALQGLPAKGSYVGETATASDGTEVSWNGSSWAKQPGFFDGLMKSPMAQYGVIQAAGSFLSGAFDPLKPAQVDALSAQAANNRAAAALTTQQTQNMTGKLPVASRVQAPAITGAPARSTGLINSMPQQAA